MYPVADAAYQALLLMKHIADRKDRMNIVIAIDLIAPIVLKNMTLKKYQYLEMLVKVTLQGKAQAHVVLKMNSLSSPGARENS